MTTALADRCRKAVRRDRLVQTVVDLCAVPSRTGEAGGALDRLAEIMRADGFSVERAAAGHAQAPAVIVRWPAKRPGPVIQFNGHLDVVHLPFVAPRVEGDLIHGSGACDMKGGTAAAVEALRALRDADLLAGGSVLLTAHDLHEAPWGFGAQLDQLIRDGVVGDAVLIPEPMHDRLPIAGRGAATWKVAVRRKGAPVHEVMRPADEPSVLAAGAELIARLGRLGEQLSRKIDPVAGCETVFVGQIHGGEIYNQYPQECRLEGTRRWLPGAARDSVEREFRELLAALADQTRTTIDCEFLFIRDAFRLELDHAAVAAFGRGYEAVCGRPLPTGPKPFVDDGNSFWGIGKVPAITHGPKAGGQHTVNEWVSIDDLCRVAAVYAATAVEFCGG